MDPDPDKWCSINGAVELFPLGLAPCQISMFSCLVLSSLSRVKLKEALKRGEVVDLNQPNRWPNLTVIFFCFSFFDMSVTRVVNALEEGSATSCTSSLFQET